MRSKLTLFILGVIVGALILASLKVYGVITGPDAQCSFPHTVIAHGPISLQTSQDYFIAGNVYYDEGKCNDAVIAYTKAVQLDPKFVQAYNNRGYTYMRLRKYNRALSDFDKAIVLDPNYPQPYLNRGDLYNFWGPVIDRQKAIIDYQKAIALGAVHNTSVCGHIAMAQTNNLIPLAVLKFVLNRGYCK